MAMAKLLLASGQISPESASSPAATSAGLPQSRRTGRAPSAKMSSTGIMLQKKPTSGPGPSAAPASIRSWNQAMFAGR